jgi:hypothetical protein
MAYVYAILVNGVVRYIGKGNGGRIHDHLKVVRSLARRRAAGEVVRSTLFYNKLTRAWLDGSKIEHMILADSLTDDEAYAREAIEISHRKDLWNMDPGGRGRGFGYKQSKKMRAKRKATMKDRPLSRTHCEALRGIPKTYTDEVKKRLSVERSKRMMRRSKKERIARAQHAGRLAHKDEDSTQLKVLELIREKSGLNRESLEELAASLGLAPTTVKNALHRLSKRGLIEKRGGHCGGFHSTNIAQLRRVTWLRPL